MKHISSKLLFPEVFTFCKKYIRKKTKSDENLTQWALKHKFNTIFSQSIFLHVDKNECLDNKGNCSQYCFNERGDYRCGCGIGYTLEEDGRSCKGKGFLWRQVLLEMNKNEKKYSQTLKNYAIKNPNLHA